MRTVIVVTALAGSHARYGLLMVVETRAILGVYGPLGPREQRAVLAGRRPFDPDRAAWARRQRWGPALALALAPPDLVAKTPTATARDPLAKTALPADTDPVAKTAAPTPTRWYRQRLVRCGNPCCVACKDGPAHGPYWYVLWREDGRLHSRYLGKTRPPDASDPAV